MSRTLPIRIEAVMYRLVLCTIAAFCVATNCLGADQSPGPRPLNIVFILADDLGWMDIGPNNPHSFYDTPSLDRLARSGVRFTQAYAACSVCSPTRYSIQTGKYPARIGLTSWLGGNPTKRFAGAPLTQQMPLEEVTIAEALAQAHYRTALVGKWHLGGEPYWPEHQGYELNIGGHSGGSTKSYFSPYHNPRLPDGPPGEFLTTRLVDESIRFLEQHQKEPTLLFLSMYSVHTPLQAPQSLIDKYNKRLEGLKPVEEFAEEEQVWPTREPRKVRIVQRHAVYAAMMEAMDREIGRLLDKLDELKLSDHTLVIFTSDNGGLATSEGLPTSNLPLRGGKGWQYEGGIRVPLLLRWPGVTKAQSTCETPVISTDFYPTLLQAAGLPLRPEQHMDGISLAAALNTKSSSTDRTFFWHFPHYANQGGFPAGVIRQGDYKLIERYEDGRVHLYNLAEDLGERKDLAADQPEHVRAMRDQLHAWYKQVGAKFLTAKDSGPQPWRPE